MHGPVNVKCTSFKNNFHIQFTKTPKCFDLLQIFLRDFYIKHLVWNRQNIIRLFYIRLLHVKLPQDDPKKSETFRSLGEFYVQVYF